MKMNPVFSLNALHPSVTHTYLSPSIFKTQRYLEQRTNHSVSLFFFYTSRAPPFLISWLASPSDFKGSNFCLDDCDLHCDFRAFLSCTLCQYVTVRRVVKVIAVVYQYSQFIWHVAAQVITSGHVRLTTCALSW